MEAFFRILMFLTLISLSFQFGDDYFTPHVLMVRNRLTYQYLSVNNDSVSSSTDFSNPCK